MSLNLSLLNYHIRMNKPKFVYQQVLIERNQHHEGRKHLFLELEKVINKPVVAFFTSFTHNNVMIDQNDPSMLEGILRTMDLSNGLCLIINSPGGSGLAAEGIINICRNYSRTGEFDVIIPDKAKSAATMVAFGSSKIIMSSTSELGPIDPQIQLIEGDTIKWFPLFNIVESYNKLFKDATRVQGNIEPYLQQLSIYDPREIKTFQDAIALADDIAVRALASGMMKGKKNIKKNIANFLTPKTTKDHGRAIYIEEAKKSGLMIEEWDLLDEKWNLVYELFVRINNFVSDEVTKCVENKEYSFAMPS